MMMKPIVWVPSRVLGLDTETLQPLGERRWVWMAAQAASVSYSDAMDELAVVDALSTGRVPSKFFAHVCTLFDEVPLQIVIMACSQVARQSRITMDMVWKNVAMLTRLVAARRTTVWGVSDG
ncbi:hypothetical protein GTP41_19310 [Pseudoduganella sp. DS3]|uniref:Uncharacterized protein n=1 Tax=Pseudoduganella guangdongensis TaxID=2692179 RepID=A0A6N9HKW0_9BURK|nr:hypothetical protein [Pseudoduganella guangdongensis]MYN04244.1 hypothetical protein [Pseudoduganella guangdongensis]